MLSYFNLQWHLLFRGHMQKTEGFRHHACCGSLKDLHHVAGQTGYLACSLESPMHSRGIAPCTACCNRHTLWKPYNMLASGFLGHICSWGIRPFWPWLLHSILRSFLGWDSMKKEWHLLKHQHLCCLAEVFTERGCSRRCCCFILLFRKKAGWCFSAGYSIQVAVTEKEHETQRKTMNSGKVKVRPAAEERLQRYLQRLFWGKKKKIVADNIHINEPETILKNNLLSFLRSKEHED